MEEYIQYLQAQLEFLQEQQPVMSHNPEDARSDEEIEAFNRSSSELSGQLEECRMLNNELKFALENEKRAKESLEEEFGQIKQKVMDCPIFFPVSDVSALLEQNSGIHIPIGTRRLFTSSMEGPGIIQLGEHGSDDPKTAIACRVNK